MSVQTGTWLFTHFNCIKKKILTCSVMRVRYIRRTNLDAMIKIYSGYNYLTTNDK